MVSTSPKCDCICGCQCWSETFVRNVGSQFDNLIGYFNVILSCAVVFFITLDLSVTVTSPHFQNLFIDNHLFDFVLSVSHLQYFTEIY